jgi:hypothetical protein
MQIDNRVGLGEILPVYDDPLGDDATQAAVRSDTAMRMSRLRGALPWMVTAVWLIGTLFAFWFFELRLPRVFWCSGSGL